MKLIHYKTQLVLTETKYSTRMALVTSWSGKVQKSQL